VNGYTNNQKYGSLWFNRPSGIFNLSFLHDYSSASIPQLKISNCEFLNFNYHKYILSLIALDRRASLLSIDDTLFRNSYFPYGLISDSFE